MASDERKYFGTDGIRGVATEKPLDPETLVRLGQAIAQIFIAKRGRHRILIGKDTRLSGYMIETALSAGIMSMGADVLLVGPIPTPGVAYLTKSMRADAGIMISASHNPFEDNGIKIFGADGFKLPDEKELEIEALLSNGVSLEAKAEPGKVGKAQRIDDALGRYTVFLKENFPRELSVEGMRIGFDCANGAAYQLAPQTFRELGAEVMARGISPNGRNINAGFGSLYPEIVRELVLENNLDLGVSLDGDADRAVFVDEKGSVLDGDVVLAICALDLASRGMLHGNTVVATVMSNLGLQDILNQNNIQLVRSQVGDRYVLEEMLKNGYNLGGEQSGHTIFSDISTSGDGTLTALKIVEVMRRTGKPLSELAAPFRHFPQKLLNIAVREKPALESLPSVVEVMSKVESELGDKGRVLVRYSGTENKARVMVECEEAEKCKEYASAIASAIEREIGAV
ncbi:MAG: phosphoglucosamine mutase [Bdellovibrionales bacterium]|nr:phosphoglucosamine mutase [Bdellovibrionales bacterium]